MNTVKMRFRAPDGTIVAEDSKYGIERVQHAVEQIARTLRKYDLGSWREPVRLGLPRSDYLRLLWAMHRDADNTAPLLEEIEFLGLRIYGLGWPYFS